MRLPIDSHGLTWRAEALDSGHSEDDLAQLIASKDLLRVSRGVYVIADRVKDLYVPDELYRLKCVAAATRTDTPFVLSHQSAAAVLRLPLLNPDRSRVHVVRDGARGSRRSTRHVHEGPTEGATVTVDGMTLTGLLRTTVDVAAEAAAGGRFARALAVFDSALRAGVLREELTEVLEQRRRRGIAVARYALRLADGRAANPGESWSRAQLIEAGLPKPDLQHEYVVTIDGVRQRAFTDFDWNEKVSGELDGTVKYLKHRRPGESELDAILREKKREEALRDVGTDPIRWTIDDLWRGRMVGRVAERLRRFGIL
ncbi:MAG: hypothetical protein WAW85_11435 [Gordonia sp. (in: high G+C Gram-positive bacteria)]